MRADVELEPAQPILLRFPAVRIRAQECVAGISPQQRTFRATVKHEAFSVPKIAIRKLPRLVGSAPLASPAAVDEV